MPDIGPALAKHSITASHKSWKEKGFIVTFEINPSKINQVTRKSQYDKCFANDPIFQGECFWVLRLAIDENGLCLRPHKVDKESILFLHEMPVFLLEYTLNKLFVFVAPAHMCLVLNWETVKFIAEPNPVNTYKTYAFPVPDFDEETNPFIVVLGLASLNILNVRTCQHKPLINQKMEVG